jgi:hypothetical protein
VNEKANHSARGMVADGLMLAVTLSRERLPNHLDAKLVIAYHRVAALVVGDSEQFLLEDAVEALRLIH